MTEWQDDDEVTTTYGTLKRSMLEARGAERKRILDVLEGLKGDCPLSCKDCENHASTVWAAIAAIKGELS
jgi:hypothetical protein